jgi:hypothetical protein
MSIPAQVLTILSVVLAAPTAPPDEPSMIRAPRKTIKNSLSMTLVDAALGSGLTRESPSSEGR